MQSRNFHINYGWTERLAFRSSPLTSTRTHYFRSFYVSVERLTEKRRGFLLFALLLALSTSKQHPQWTPVVASRQLRFVARSVVPDVIWSDNGINFMATEKELLPNVLNLSQWTLNASLMKKNIKWKFKLPSAPHDKNV